jgi:hypothetical protein
MFVAYDLFTVLLEAIEVNHSALSGCFSANAALHLYMRNATLLNKLMLSFDF